MSEIIKAVTHPNKVEGFLPFDPDGTDTTRFGVYSTGTVQQYELSTRFQDGDRVFRYGRAGAALIPKLGAKNWGQFINENTVAARAIGDTFVTITLDATSGGATWFGVENNMVGGYFSQPDTANSQFRRIIGHRAGASGATIRVNLDGPLTRTMVTNSFSEWMQNPYRDLRQTGNTFSSVMGVPTTAIASGSFGWFQTWGPAWMNPNQPVADTANWRTVVFRDEGSVIGFDDATAEAGHQVAGFVIDRTGNGSDNPPFIFLQISP